MSIKQNGGVFGRNPTFNDVTIEGQLTFNGDIDINSDLKVDGDIETTGNVIIATSGKGIDFSATAGTGTSELLDDYEEGDWTPLIADASSGGNAGSGSVVGKYTKVGRQVTIIAVLNNIVTTGLTAGNDLFLLGIPFTPSSFSALTKNTAPVSTSSVNNAANSYLTAILHDNTNYMRIQENITNATNDYILVSEITSGTSDFNFTLTYFTDS